MSASAVAMMIVAMVVIFGGLVVSAITLMTHPEQPDTEE
ncbi:methionine/alanine import family NSS transporter small subunit [Glycomyces sp. L485]|nr:methionine/alanine import family NSS transporter small subunit [Glycomyces sp. L485]MCH7232397.1 methionine/alanine import family NSS transporter small subunit [Glycomyces sp. L485]